MTLIIKKYTVKEELQFLQKKFNFANEITLEKILLIFTFVSTLLINLFAECLCLIILGFKNPFWLFPILFTKLEAKGKLGTLLDVDPPKLRWQGGKELKLIFDTPLPHINWMLECAVTCKITIRGEARGAQASSLIAPCLMPFKLDVSKLQKKEEEASSGPTRLRKKFGRKQRWSQQFARPNAFIPFLKQHEVVTSLTFIW